MSWGVDQSWSSRLVAVPSYQAPVPLLRLTKVKR